MLFRRKLLFNIMEMDDIVISNLCNKIDFKTRNELLGENKFKAIECENNWNYALQILNDNSIRYEIDDAILFNIGSHAYKLMVSTLGYGLQIAKLTQKRFPRKVHVYTKKDLKPFLERIIKTEYNY